MLHARGHQGVPFEAGQFAWLKFGGSPFVFEEHPFTIASTATEPWRKEFTIKALGDFTELMSAMRPGRRVYLDGPHGRFTFAHVAGGDGFVFLAGGVGITPMLSMLRTLAANHDPRPALLVVGGRTVDGSCTVPSSAELAAADDTSGWSRCSAPHPTAGPARWASCPPSCWSACCRTPGSAAAGTGSSAARRR